jgi:hypothetical protein
MANSSGSCLLQHTSEGIIGWHGMHGSGNGINLPLIHGNYEHVRKYLSSIAPQTTTHWTPWEGVLRKPPRLCKIWSANAVDEGGRFDKTSKEINNVHRRFHRLWFSVNPHLDKSSIARKIKNVSSNAHGKAYRFHTIRRPRGYESMSCSVQRDPS